VSFSALRGAQSVPHRISDDGAKLAANEARAKIAFDRVTVRLTAKGYKVELHARQDTDCVPHSYGRVQSFLRSNPCTSLERAYVELRDKHKNVVLVALSRVDMPNAEAASRFKALVDVGGTGNVTELSRDGGAFRNVRYDGMTYASGLDGPNTVWNLQVQPAGWSTAAKILNEIRGASSP
jgi:hypothetical protein